MNSTNPKLADSTLILRRFRTLQLPLILKKLISE